MSIFNSIFVYFAVFNFVDETGGLVELPQVEDNDIIKTEDIVRSTTNKVFSNLQLRGVKDKLKLQQFSLIHNYFVSLTLQDYNSLKEIGRLSRVDNRNINNETTIYMAVLDEVLNEDSNITEHENVTNAIDINDDIINYIDNHLKRLGYLKHLTTVASSSDTKNEILEVLTNKEGHTINSTHTKDNDTVLDENEFWDPEESGRRIYNGKTTKIKHFPFMAAVLMFKQFQCGGSIIHDDLILTASSCLQLAWNNRFYRENPSFLSVRIGSDFYNDGGEEVAVLEVYFHPSYNPRTLRNNLAVLRLARKINLKRIKRKGRVKKIRLDKFSSPLPMNTDGVTIVGWGAKTRGNTVQNPWEGRLSFAILDAYLLDDCQDTYSREYVTRKHFCAGFISKGSGACNRDVGGPGVVSGHLVGVVSFGSPVCGSPDAPTVFTKVGYYREWIESIMEQEVHIPNVHRKTTTKSMIISHIRVTSPTPKTTFILGPLEEAVLKPLAINPPKPDLRDLDDVTKFREFLKTMFDSDEMEEYKDLNENDEETVARNIETVNQPQKQIKKELNIKEEEKIVPKEPMHIATETESPKFLEFATKIDDYEPKDDVVESEVEIVTEAVEFLEHNTFMEGPKDHDTSETEENKDLNSEARKELERDLMKLIDRADLKEIVKGSIPDTIKDVATDKDIDDTILTLLYVSDNENGNSGIKIFEKVGNDNDTVHKDDNDKEVGVPLIKDANQFVDDTSDDNDRKNYDKSASKYKNDVENSKI